MNKINKIVGIVGALGASALMGRGEFRSPIDATWGHIHSPLRSVQEAWWFGDLPEQKPASKWSFAKWATMYSRSASKMFRKESDHDKHTTDTQELSALWFGSEVFRVKDSFVNAQVNDPLLLSKTNPFIGSARIRPIFDYNEKGVVMGGCVDYTIDDEGMWHVGAKVALPFVVVEIEPDASGENVETLEDMFKVSVIRGDQTSPTTPTLIVDKPEIAIRMDLLNSLAFDETKGMLRLEGGEVKVGSRTISGANAAAANMYVIRRNSGIEPDLKLRRLPTEVNGGALNAAGTNGADDAVMFFQSGVAYNAATGLLNNADELGNLYLVPKAQDAVSLTPEAQSVVDRILFAVDLADLDNKGVTDFLFDNYLDLRYERKVGLGDMDAHIYGMYGNPSDWFVKFSGGVKFPTGTKRNHDDSYHLLQLQTGNNRHWELGLCLMGGWMPLDWMSFDLGVTAHHAFKRSEEVMAVLKGSATKNNSGVLVEGDVSWSYFTGHVTLNFFHPYNKELGCSIGYQLYAKTKDRVSYDVEVATDILGRTKQALDSDLAEVDTNGFLHKIRAEIFNRWNYFELNAGVSHAVAGKNAMKESEMHLGFKIYF